MKLNEETKEEKKAREDESICGKTLDVVFKGFIPKIQAARDTDETVFRPFRYCHTSWRERVPVIRQQLIEIWKRWDELGLTGQCPHTPTETELVEHKKQYEEFETAQRMKASFMQILHITSDGFVEQVRWDEVRTKFVELYDILMDIRKDLEDAEDGYNAIGTAKMIWAFDEPDKIK